MNLTPSQIEVLARFDGWELLPDGRLRKSIPSLDGWGASKYKPKAEVIPYLTSPGVLIEMRLKLYEKIYALPRPYQGWEELLGMVMNLGDLILNKEYTAAAIKTSEIIQKLQS
jgi:hypothetical protein